ncbi:universal stress protein [Halomonas salifodinae]|uniref:universal stress protein n=1 Tax=Halomonas salifodinae TaxID=438745 RepID=UPI0033BC1E30
MTAEVPLRVLALLDASPASVAALPAAVALAASREAELLALYVEEPELAQCAALPFTREVGARSGAIRGFSPADMALGQACRLARIHEALRQSLAGQALSHSLAVGQGAVVAEVLRLVRPVDLLVLGRAGFSARWGRPLGSTCRRLLMEAPCAVLIWNDARVMAPGALRTLGEPAPSELLDWLTAGPLFDRVERLAPVSARELARRLAGERRGGLLLRRGQLTALLAEEPDWLGPLHLPLLVIP